MKKKELKTKLNQIHSELRNLNAKLNTLLIQEYHFPDVAAELQLSAGSVYKIDTLELPYFKRGKFRVYRKEDVLRYKVLRENLS